MKIIFVILFFGLNSFAGHFARKSLYVETHISIGNGKTLAEAKQDALNSIPKATKYLYYEPNTSWGSPAYQCIDTIIWSEKDECYGGLVQYVIPLKMVSQ